MNLNERLQAARAHFEHHSGSKSMHHLGILTSAVIEQGVQIADLKKENELLVNAVIKLKSLVDAGEKP